MTKTIETPNYGSLTHDDIKKLFVKIINIVQPKHPYFDNVYPVDEENIKYSYKQRTSSYYASCGPRKVRKKPILFKADKHYFNNKEPERILAILTHEITHVTVGGHSNVESGSHPPRFWRKFGFNAHILLDNWDAVQEYFGDVSKKDFIGYIIKKEVTKYNIDNRYGDEMLRKHEMANWFNNTLRN